MTKWPKYELLNLQNQIDDLEAGVQVLELTASAAVPASTQTGSIITNRGAAGTVVATLPAGSTLSGLATWTFRALDQILRLDPNAADNLRYSGGAMAAGEYLELAAESSCVVTWDGTEWLVTAETGTLTEETP